MKKLLFLLIAVFLLNVFFIACTDWSIEPPPNNNTDISWYDRNKKEFTLSTSEQLKELAKLVNYGTDNFYGKTIFLANDLTLNEIENWTPIGNENRNFSGIFDGQNNTISGLKINSPNKDYQGLFGYTNGAKILNVKISGAVVIGNYNVGALVGRAGNGIYYRQITVQNCSAENVSVEGSSWVGGLIGVGEGKIEKCFVSGAIVKSNIYGYSGGLLGQLFSGAIILNSYAVNCEVISEYGNKLAVLAGHLYDSSEMQNCYAVGSINTPSNETGGLYWAYGGTVTVTDSYYSSQINNKQSGLSLSQMKTQATFRNWDFDNIWQIDPNKNSGFPTLK